jgi:hypothetical protein
VTRIDEAAARRNPNLFGWADEPPTSYPDEPGWKGQLTSRQAARAVAGKAKSVRQRCLEVIKAAPGPISSDEVAAQLEYEPMWIRPRVSELCKQGLIFPVAERAKNRSGHSALMWRAA